MKFGGSALLPLNAALANYEFSNRNTNEIHTFRTETLFGVFAKFDAASSVAIIRINSWLSTQFWSL
ncbi:hypothetical protein D5E85_20665 [Vibrio parahaemolyticus]|nr:hypothetical protein D5E85_20665 [Vibrio parahaemolyticus]